MSIAAELHRKTPFIYSEDLLTSDLFGALRYLPAHDGVIGFLRSVEGLAGVIEAPDPASTCDIYFWPQGGAREPDVLLELSIRGRLYHVVVEAKYLSGPSDSEDVTAGEGDETVLLIGNQLAAEFADLLHGVYRVHTSRWESRPLRLESAPGDRLLLYLTAHSRRPQGELLRFGRYHPGSAAKLFWASWYQVHDYLAARAELWDRPPYREIAGDLLALLRHKGFCPFRGLPAAPVLEVGSLPGYRWLG